LGGTEEGFRRVLRHHFAAEDTAALDHILGRQYQVVVGNPPYITPKDAAMRDAYREIYESCHMKYGLGVPFTERLFDLAQEGAQDRSAGFVGLIVANSFMKREFGRKLIERVLPRLDLTHVVDCSDAHIPGHGTPTAILLGRNRPPVASVVRTVRKVRGERATPEDPAKGLVWSAIVAQVDLATSRSDFISTEDTPRETLSRHPWNMGGGGATEVQEAIEADRKRLSSCASEIGITSVTGEDDLYLFDDRRAAERLGIRHIKPLIIGDLVRDYRISSTLWAVWPHRADFGVRPLSEIPDVARHLWLARTVISKRKRFGTPMLQRGLTWYEFQELYSSKLQTSLTITFAFVATHNHFVLDRGDKVFKQSAPVIKLPSGASEEDHLGLLGLLNSSSACFWLRQVSHDKGGGGIGGGIAAEYWEKFLELTGTGLQRFPLASERPLDLARALDAEAQHLSANLPAAVCARVTPTRNTLDATRVAAEAARSRMVAMQEELDWRCYRLYGLLENATESPEPPPLRLGERAFEIVMARRIAAGELETTWFERHRSTPIPELPQHWPADYRAIVERRIALIESDPTIGLIERPEYKRRWSAPTWEEMERDALRAWLLDRLEAPRFWQATDPRILSTVALADLARHDPDFLSVAELYAGRAGVDLDALVAELVASESVPFLSVLRYTETGLRKRADWEGTWDKQRAEDAIDVELATRRDEFLRSAWARMNLRDEGETPEAYAIRMTAGLDDKTVLIAAAAAIAKEAGNRKKAEVGDIPVPPKYRTPDFRSQDFWRLRGGLDVPKERFVSFPHGARDADPSLPILWAGYDHLARASAIAAWYVERKDTDGWPAERLKPLLAGLLELVPWLLQWHNDIDPQSGLRMGDFFQGYVEEEARQHGLTLDDLRTWKAPASVRRSRGRRTAA
jgi:hypothetical protein